MLSEKYFGMVINLNILRRFQQKNKGKKVV